jgi:molybdate transport system substrate-binding protein
LFVRLGIADEIKSKIKPAPTAAAEFVANGEAEIGMTQISEILPFAGADLVGPLPADIQLYTSFAGANGTATKQPEAGKALFKFLVAPDTAKIMKAKGLEPAS